jgi:hypothetical protein
MRHRTSDRDGGLRRVSHLTRWLTAGAVALVGVLSAIVAQAVPGSSSGTATTPTPTGDVGTAPAPATTQPTRPPATSPSVTDPGLQPAPAPVPTPRRSVAHSHAS